MSFSLITCIGNRDPFDSKSKHLYGPAAACVVVMKPSKVVILSTPGTQENKDRFIGWLEKNCSGIAIEELDTGLTNPSDLDAVDKALRKALRTISISDDKVLVNASSGTPQMSICLQLLLATEYLKGRALRVSDPKYIQCTHSSEQEDGLELTEPYQSVFKRVEQKGDQSSPVFDHITRSNAIKLIRRYDYCGAKTLLHDATSKRLSALRAEYNAFVLPLLDVANCLTLLNTDEAKKHYEELKKATPTPYCNDIEKLGRSLHFHRATLFYLATEIRERIGRFDDFIRGAGLTREVCLQYHIERPVVAAAYASALMRRKGSADILNRKKLEQSNPALLSFVEKRMNEQQNNSDYFSDDSDSANAKRVFKEEQELWAAIQEYIIDYAASKDHSLSVIATAISSSQALRGFRNKYVHNLKAVEQGEVREAKACFKNMLKLLPDSDHKFVLQHNPFDLINEILTHFLRYQGSA